jgi:hypothetical protein
MQTCSWGFCVQSCPIRPLQRLNMTVWTIADRGSLIFEEKFRPKILTDMKRPDFIPDNTSENENKSDTQNGPGSASVPGMASGTGSEAGECTDSGSAAGTTTGTGSGTDNKTASGSRTRVIIRIIGIGILCLISVAIMALVIWINIRSRLN